MTSTTVERTSYDFQGATVVVDTSALLASTQDELLNALQGANMVIPAIVIVELEKLRTSGSVGYAARCWLRTIEELRSTEGDAIGYGLEYKGVTVSVQMNHTEMKLIPSRLQNGSPDSLILAVAANTAAETSGRVVLLTNDSPMRLHATLTLKLEAEGFTPRSLENEGVWDGAVTLTLTESEAVGFTNLVAGSPLSEEDKDDVRARVQDVAPNISRVLVKVKLESGETIADLALNPDDVVYAHRNSEKGNAKKHDWIKPRTVEQKLAVSYLREDWETLPLVSIGGRAGTGKTLLSTVVGLQEVKADKYDKVMVFRGLHEMGHGQEMGFLPGDVDEKMAPWKGAINDALEAIERNTNDTMDILKKRIEVNPITYLRGRTLANAFIILEEAQNFSRSEILNVMSRIGEGSKLVLTFDDGQVDNRFLQSFARADVWSVVNRMATEDLFAHITLTKTERSPAAELASRVLLGG